VAARLPAMGLLLDHRCFSRSRGLCRHATLAIVVGAVISVVVKASCWMSFHNYGASAVTASSLTRLGTQSGMTVRQQDQLKRSMGGKPATSREAAVTLDPPAPPETLKDAASDPQSFVQCTVFADKRAERTCTDNCRPDAGDPEWQAGAEAWLFRQPYIAGFEMFLRKLGYHLSMIYRNVKVECEERSTGELFSEKCIDCIRHLSSDAYGELGMIVPAHPDESVRGRRDAPAVDALDCLVQGKVFNVVAPLFCRTSERGA